MPRVSASALCNTLQYFATNCNTLQHTATHCRAMLVGASSRCMTCIVWLHITRQNTATHCNILQHTATHCNLLQHTAKTCYQSSSSLGALQPFCGHMSTHCNTLQHTATHCNTLQYGATPHNNCSDTLIVRAPCRCTKIFLCMSMCVSTSVYLRVKCCAFECVQRVCASSIACVL